MRSWSLVLAMILVPSASWAQGAARNAELERGKKSLEGFKYAEAGKSFDVAWLMPGNDRETVLEILKLQAVVAATLGQQERARSLFRTLLYLAPNFELPEGDLGPRVLSLYYEGKGRVSVEGWLKIEPGPIVRDGERVHQLSVKVTDPQKMVKAVRFHSRPPVLLWSEAEVPVTDGKAALSVDGPTVDWWVEALGDNSRVLGQLGSAEQPVRTSKGFELVPEDPRPETAAARIGPRSLKPVAYIAAGAGVLAAIPGVVFGIRSNNFKNQIVAAERDVNGRVTGITREKALLVNDEQRTSATIANSLFVTSTVLIGAGVVLYLLSPDAKLSVSPAGVSMGGTFE